MEGKLAQVGRSQGLQPLIEYLTYVWCSECPPQSSSYNLCSEKLTLIIADGASHVGKETINSGNEQGMGGTDGKRTVVRRKVLSVILVWGGEIVERVALKFHTNGLTKSQDIPSSWPLPLGRMPVSISRAGLPLFTLLCQCSLGAAGGRALRSPNLEGSQGSVSLEHNPS